MGFLLDKLKPKKEIANLQNADTNSTFVRPFALLQEEQLDKFVRGLLEGTDSLYDKVYKKTGNKSLTNEVKGSTIHSPRYKAVKGFEEYTDLAAFEALLCGMFPWDNDMPGSSLEYGQGTFFAENGFVVKYFKEKPLYERNHSKDQNGNFYREVGIIQFFYQSPIGNFIIKQNHLNNRIFELYISESISETLLEKLSKALQISLDIIEPKSIENNFHERYKVKIDTPSTNIKFQEQINSLLLNIDDSRSEI